MIKRMYPLLLAFTLCVTSACTSSENGRAQIMPSNTAAPTTVTQQTPTSGTSAVVDPCTLLDAENDLAEYGKFRDPQSETLGGARSCFWHLQRENPAEDGLVVSLDVRDSQPVDSINEDGGGIQTAEVNGRTAARAPNPEIGDCTIALELTQTSRIDIGINSVRDVNESCQIAQDVAYIVEPRLPQA